MKGAAYQLFRLFILPEQCLWQALTNPSWNPAQTQNGPPSPSAKTSLLFSPPHSLPLSLSLALSPSLFQHKQTRVVNKNITFNL